MDPLEQVPSQPFRLREFLVEPQLHRITGPQGVSQVEPRVIDLLVVLASRPGDVWSRNELLDTVWHGTIVNEEALSRAISQLRRHLGDDAGNPRFIETIRKGGYRLICPVEPHESSTPVPGGTSEDESEPEPPPPSRSGRTEGRRAGTRVMAVAVVIALAALVGTWLRFGPTQAGLRRSNSTPPAVVSFTSYPGEEILPSISPDGSLVAYVGRAPGSTSLDLFVKHADTGTPLRLTDTPTFERFSTWAPEGSEIAFGRSGPDGHGIFVISAIGGTARQLIETASPVEGLSWSPSGEQIVFAEEPEGTHTFRLRLLDVPTGDVTDLTNPLPSTRGDLRPAFSPDGRWVAFDRGDAAGNEDVWMVPAAGGPARQLTHGQLRVRGITWEPSSAAVIFSGVANGTHTLWRLDWQSGKKEWIPTPGEESFDPTIASSSGTFIYVDVKTEKNIWVTDADPSSDSRTGPRRLIQSTHEDSDPRFSPLGDRIAFVSSRTGARELWVSSADGTDPERVTDFGGAFVGLPNWSPDGTILAFSATVDGYAAVHTVALGRGAPVRLTDTGSNAIPLAWAESVQRIYFTSDRTGEWEVWSMNSDGSDLRQVSTAGGRYVQFDEDWIYLIRPSASRLWRLPLRATEEEQPAEQILSSLPDGPGRSSWVLRRDGLYASGWRGDDPVIVRLALNTSQTDTLAVVPGMASFTVSPDGRTLAYARVENTEADLKLISNWWHPGN